LEAFSAKERKEKGEGEREKGKERESEGVKTENHFGEGVAEKCPIGSPERQFRTSQKQASVTLSIVDCLNFEGRSRMEYQED